MSKLNAMTSRSRHSGALTRKNPPVAVIGLGLMGHSIIACFLSAGYRVFGVTRDLRRHRGTPAHIRTLLKEMKREGLLKLDPGKLMDALQITEQISDLAPCTLIVESIIEDIQTKMDTYRMVEKVVAADAIIGTNTSSIPVSLLQRGAAHPERFVGIHWDEPAHITRFMEIIVGEQTDPKYADAVMVIAARLGKEPSLLRRDIRGFITNRVSYAMFREACSLVDSGVCTVEDVDRSLRNDVGYWMPFAGPFRYMDLMGVEGYYRVMKDLLPDLCSSPEIPATMRKVIESGGKGISNGRGFYKYSAAEAKRWSQAFVKFNYQIRRLALQYPSELKKSK